MCETVVTDSKFDSFKNSQLDMTMETTIVIKVYKSSSKYPLSEDTSLDFREIVFHFSVAFP